ncbi:hypothetical protein AM233_22595 [Bacillus sp. FJAT-22058]|nr:hypothetical protein AM233_22595 [Bacillus sp. FJAT-22058]
MGGIKNLSLMGMGFYLRDARLLREMRVQGRPRRQMRRGGSRTARGKRVPGVEINGSSFTNQKTAGNMEVYLNTKTKLTETKCTRLLREKRVHGRPRRRKSAEEAHGPPAESECLEWRSTIRVLQTLKKIIDNKEFYLTVKTKLIGTEGTRLLREMRVQGETPQARSVEGGPPAESECLE